MSATLTPITPAEFSRRTRDLVNHGMQPIDIRAHAVGLMALTLSSLGYGDGVDLVLEVTKGVRR